MIPLIRLIALFFGFRVAGLWGGFVAYYLVHIFEKNIRKLLNSNVKESINEDEWKTFFHFTTGSQFQSHYQSQRQNQSQYRSQSYAPPPHYQSSEYQLQEAYKLLGVTASSSNDQIKKAYRRLMNQYHPDKLAAKGLSKAVMKASEEKTQAIGAAYKILRQARAFR